MKNSERHFPIVVGKTWIHGYYEQFKGLYEAINEFNKDKENANQLKYNEKGLGYMLGNKHWAYSFCLNSEGVLCIDQMITYEGYMERLKNGKYKDSEIKEFKRGHKAEFIIEEEYLIKLEEERKKYYAVGTDADLPF